MVRRRAEGGVPIEVGARETFAELVYLIRRARHLWPRVLLVAALITSLYAVRQLRKVQTFTSRVVLRISEGEGDQGTRPAPARKLQTHVYDVIFSKQRLRELATKYKLEQSAFKRDPEAGYENLREAIEIEVWQNYFLDAEAQEKTARIAISFTAGDPKVALEVARALATMYIESEQQARLSISEDALGANEHLIDQAREDLEQAETQVAKARQAMARRIDASRAVMDLTSLEAQRTAIAQQLKGFEQRRTELQVQLGFEREQLGLHIEVVDSGKEQTMAFTRPQRVLLGSGAAFVLSLLAAGILLAAFDDRVRDRRDLRLIGMPLLGELPAPPDPQSLSLQQRVQRAARTRAEHR